MSFKHPETYINTYSKNSDGSYFLLDGGSTSFSMEESIYSLNTKMKMYINESQGIVSSFRLTDINQDFFIEYAIGSYKLTKRGKVFSSSTKSTNIPTKFSPQFNLELKTYWDSEVSKISRAYKNKRISEIVSSKATDHSFQTDINDTGNFHTWYQTNETSKEFLKRISQYCYSDNANNSPFFLYQTLDDTIHLRSGYSLESQKSKLTFTLIFSSPDLVKNNGDINTITDLQRIDDGSFNSRHLSRIDAYTINRTTGAVDFLSNKQSETPSQIGNKKILIQNLLDDELQYPTEVDNFLFGETTTGTQENQKGLLINKLKKYYFTEKYMFSIPAGDKTIQLRAGDKISLVIPVGNASSASFNKNLSQDFIIEKKVELWNAKDQYNLCIFVIGRRTGIVPSTDPNYNNFS